MSISYDLEKRVIQNFIYEQTNRKLENFRFLRTSPEILIDIFFIPSSFLNVFVMFNYVIFISLRQEIKL